MAARMGQPASTYSYPLELFTPLPYQHATTNILQSSHGRARIFESSSLRSRIFALKKMPHGWMPRCLCQHPWQPRKGCMVAWPWTCWCSGMNYLPIGASIPSLCLYGRDIPGVIKNKLAIFHNQPQKIRKHTESTARNPQTYGFGITG